MNNSVSMFPEGKRGVWYKVFKVKIRRTIGLVVKPECEQIDGQTYVFRYGWTIDDDDSRYPGEQAWIPDDSRYPVNAPEWIASGDLEESFIDGTSI